jgi:ribosomal protein L7Ae-like RNA K-turn-binding protein
MSEADPVLRLLGLAARAGGVVSGTERVRNAANGGEVRFALLAADASENSRAKLMPALVANEVEHVVAYDRERLGAAVGRAPLSAVGVVNASLAARMKVLIGPAFGAERK